MAYRQIEGDRRGSILYEHNNFLYSNFRNTETKKILRCREWRKSNCKGMGSIRKRDYVFTVMQDHSHDVEEKAVSVFEMKHEMKRRAETSNEPIRRIFDEVCATAPPDVSISFNQVENTLYKRRRSVEPPLPTSAIESSEILVTHPDLCDAYQCHVVTDDGIAVIFHTEEQRRMVEGEANYNAAHRWNFQNCSTFFQASRDYPFGKNRPR